MAVGLRDESAGDQAVPLVAHGTSPAAINRLTAVRDVFAKAPVEGESR
jgi:hypothetical protein